MNTRVLKVICIDMNEAELFHTNPQTHTHTHLFTPCVLQMWVCVSVLFMCFYVFPLVISWAFCSAGTPGDRKRRQTWFDVVEFSAIAE